MLEWSEQSEPREAFMPTWTEGDVLTNGIRMHYYRTGDGSKPAFVLCHGGSDSGLCWTPVARALEGRYDVVMIDARNHGKSEAPAGESGPNDQGDDLAGLIRALGLVRPAVMGHSMGGGAALSLAARHPDLPSRIILEDSGPFEFDPSRFDPKMMERMRDNMLAMQKMSREEIIALGHKQSPLWSDEELGPWADSKLQVNAAGMGRYTPRAATDWRDLFARVKCPVLVIRADNDKGSMVTASAADEAARLFPNVEVAYVPGAGHNVRRENYAAFMEAVKAFLDKTA
jgi:pimeloyl-ACP methyl ester carboxylesterase